jgi:hypothetical protein
VVGDEGPEAAIPVAAATPNTAANAGNTLDRATIQCFMLNSFGPMMQAAEIWLADGFPRGNPKHAAIS